MATTPTADDFQAPAEWQKHYGCLIAWPFRVDVFPFNVKKAEQAYLEVAKAVSKSECVLLFTPPGGLPADCRTQLEQEIATRKVMLVDSIQYVDSWTRDVAPTYVCSRDKRMVRGVVWTFNGWGGGEGAYTGFARDVCQLQGVDVYAPGLICEGGALAFDGEGTVITTESVLLAENRNGKIKTKGEVEEVLTQYLGCSKVIWLPEGVYGDDSTFTGGHIDNLVAFVQPAEVVMSWTDDERDPHFSVARRAKDILLRTTDAKGRVFKIHHLIQPDPPLFVTEEESSSYGPGILPPLEPGTRLPGSYVNFYISNGAVLVPQFDRPATDTAAIETLKHLFPKREIIGIIHGRQILLGGGCVHCITQQVPATIT